MKKVFLGFVASSALMAVGCGGGGGGGGGGGACSTATTGASIKLVADKVTLPTSSDAASANGYGIDLNGDNSADNKLGGLLSILNGVSSSGAGPQDSVNSAIKVDGTFILLMELAADKFTASDCSAVKVGFGSTQPNGTFDGTGTFTLSGATSTLLGPITGGVLKTNNQVTADSPFTVNVKLPLITGAPPIELTLTAASVTGTVDGTGKTITAGKINGAIKNSDLRSTVLPGVAAALTAILADPDAASTTKSAISNLLDKGNCGTAMAADGKIDTCEVSDGALKSALTPDLDLYSDTSKAADGTVVGSYGVYDPKPSTPAAAENDALSFGVGFTAVGATF